eukprot:10260777-Alexandrium_andersonii.AAC.1
MQEGARPLAQGRGSSRTSQHRSSTPWPATSCPSSSSGATHCSWSPHPCCSRWSRPAEQQA